MSTVLYLRHIKIKLYIVDEKEWEGHLHGWGVALMFQLVHKFCSLLDAEDIIIMLIKSWTLIVVTIVIPS